jgi:hypothetical protein
MQGMTTIRTEQNMCRLAFLRGHCRLEGPKYGRFNRGKKGLLAHLNRLPNALKVFCRSGNLANIPSVRRTAGCT